jgi:alkyl sulfatase BDS1-like metallo-beta-lactamase superfamily hydrolase
MAINVSNTMIQPKNSVARGVVNSSPCIKPVATSPAAADRTAYEIRLDGDATKLATLFGLLDDADPKFNIVTP